MSRVIYSFLWQLRDLLVFRGSLMILLGFFAYLLPPMLAPEVVAFTGPEATLNNIITSASVFFSVIAVATIVHQDRNGEFYKVLFARPISPVLYYLRKTAAAWMTVVLVLALVVLLFNILVEAVPIPSGFVALTGAFLLIASWTLLISSAVNIDWLAAWVLYGAGKSLRPALEFLDRPLLAGFINAVLPPSHLDPTTTDLWHSIWYWGHPVVVGAIGLTIVWMRVRVRKLV